MAETDKEKLMKRIRELEHMERIIRQRGKKEIKQKSLKHIATIGRIVVNQVTINDYEAFDEFIHQHKPELQALQKD